MKIIKISEEKIGVQQLMAIADSAFRKAKKDLDLKSFYSFLKALKKLPIEGPKKIDQEMLKIYYMAITEKFPALYDYIYPEYLKEELKKDLANPKNEQKYIDRLLHDLKTYFLPVNDLPTWDSVIKFVNRLEGWPRKIVTNEQIVSFLKNNYYLKLIQLKPEFYESIYPEFIKYDSEIIETTKKSIVDYYAEYVNKGAKDVDKKALEMMAEFKDDDWEISILYENLYNKLKKQYIEWLSKSPQSFASECPEPFRQDEEVVIGVFSRNPNWFDEQCPEEIKNNEDVLSGIKPAIIEYFRKNIEYFVSDCPKEFKHRIEVLQALKPTFIKYFSKNPEQLIGKCPEELKSEIQNIIKQKETK